MLQKRTDLLGLWIDDINIDTAVHLAKRAVERGESVSFFTPNFEMLAGAQKSEGIKQILNSATYSIPDGFGLKIVAYILGKKLENTVAGIDFGERILSYAAKSGARVFLLGGKEGIAEHAAKNLIKNHPALKICGVHSGYFDAFEAQRVCNMINEAHTDVLIVCRGFPRQEKFVFCAKDKLKGVKVFACLGGSLDVWSGKTKRAPRVFRLIHLEWLWRISKEPQRLDRFLVSFPVLLVAVEHRVKKCTHRVIKAVREAYNQTSANF